MVKEKWKRKKILKGGVVGTLMSNYGLQKYFKNEKIRFLRTKVGDRYVKEKMQKKKFNLGGEQSGHIILGKFATTGYGISSWSGFTSSVTIFPFGTYGLIFGVSGLVPSTPSYSP